MRKAVVTPVPDLSQSSRLDGDTPGLLDLVAESWRRVTGEAVQSRAIDVKGS